MGGDGNEASAKLGISVILSGCMAARAGAGLAAVPASAAVAAAKPAMSRHHVSPFGVGARRAAHHARRDAAAPAVNASTATIRWVSNTTPWASNSRMPQDCV